MVGIRIPPFSLCLGEGRGGQRDNHAHTARALGGTELVVSMV